MTQPPLAQMALRQECGRLRGACIIRNRFEQGYGFLEVRDRLLERPRPPLDGPALQQSPGHDVMISCFLANANHFLSLVQSFGERAAALEHVGCQSATCSPPSQMAGVPVSPCSTPIAFER